MGPGAGIRDHENYEEQAQVLSLLREIPVMRRLSGPVRQQCYQSVVYLERTKFVIRRRG